LVSRPILLRAGRLAAGQGAELVQVDRFRAVRLKVGVEELEVADLVVGVVVDVLRHVVVQHLERLGVFRAAAPAGDLIVLDAAELVVLLPQVGFDDFDRSQEAENGRVPSRKTATCQGR
jgi:hypothetical protein